MVTTSSTSRTRRPPIAFGEADERRAVAPLVEPPAGLGRTRPPAEGGAQGQAEVGGDVAGQELGMVEAPIAGVARPSSAPT